MFLFLSFSNLRNIYNFLFVQDRAETPDDEKPLIQTLKLRSGRRGRNRKTRQSEDVELNNEDVPISMTPNTSILDAFEDAFDNDDDGFTTIKDLAERGITKMEPLDYDDFYLVNLYVFDQTKKIKSFFLSA